MHPGNPDPGVKAASKTIILPLENVTFNVTGIYPVAENNT